MAFRFLRLWDYFQEDPATQAGCTGRVLPRLYGKKSRVNNGGMIFSLLLSAGIESTLRRGCKSNRPGLTAVSEHDSKLTHFCGTLTMSSDSNLDGIGARWCIVWYC